MYRRKSDGKLVVAISNGNKPDGKRNRIVIYGDTEEEVKLKENIIRYELQTNQYIEPTKGTLVGFLKEYHQICAGCNMWNTKYERAKNAKWEETTAELYKMYIDVHFEPYFGSMKLTDIKAITLDKFYNNKLTVAREHKIKKGGKLITKTMPPIGLNTVGKLNKFLKAAFNYAIVNDRLKKNPTVGVKLLSAETYEPVVYNEKQFLKLLDRVRGKDAEIPIILGAGCGLRRGEICGLRWENIDFENKTISIEKTEVRFNENLEKNPKTKTSKRQLSAPPYVIDTLLEHYKSKGEPNKDEKIITRWKPQSLSEMFGNLLKEYGLEHITLHSLRHYNAVIMMQGGIPDKVAAERLGHSNVATLRKVYQHVLKDMDKTAADKINDSFSPKAVVPDEEEKQLTREERKAMFRAII